MPKKSHRKQKVKARAPKKVVQTRVFVTTDGTPPIPPTMRQIRQALVSPHNAEEWEYKTAPVSLTFVTGSEFRCRAEMEEQLNRLGKAGWELCFAFPSEVGRNCNVGVFKRRRALMSSITVTAGQ